MKVLVDDQLALLANLGVLELPSAVERPLLTVYSFQLRIASALVVHRATEGVLQRLVSTFLPEGFDIDALVDFDSALVRVIDPTKYAADVARIKSEFRCNSLAAEVVAVARREGAEVRLTPGNADGQLWGTLTATDVPKAVWTMIPTGTRVSLEETVFRPEDLRQ